jgi:PhnB protein
MTEVRLPQGVVPMLCCQNAGSALEFYKRAFGARETMDRVVTDGRVGHAEIEIAGGRIMIADEFPKHNQSPKTLGGTPVMMYVYVNDIERLASQAVAEGAKVLRGPEENRFGRLVKIEDPFGHVWFFMTSRGK